MSQTLVSIMPTTWFRNVSSLWRLASVLLLAACVLVAAPSQGAAQSLDAVRASGAVGEGADGFAVIRGNASPQTRTLVDKVNSQRRRIYADRARQQGISAAQVGAVYAGRIAAQAPKGTWIQSSSGAWSRK